MNRRQFLGASLAGIVAALSLPFERFAEWCGAWLGVRKRSALAAALEAEIDGLYAQFAEQLSRTWWSCPFELPYQRGSMNFLRAPA